MHILCSQRISPQKLETAGQLLSSFTEQFEILYGQSNVVFNIHLAKHLTDCVKFLGPLFAYSNYCFEDHIGHLISLQKGTTDIATQICGKYIMEKNLYQIIQNSAVATSFFNEISSKHRYSISQKIGGSIVIGKAKNVRENILSIIIDTFELDNAILVNEYSSVLLNSNVFYESLFCEKKRTDDTFIFNTMTKKFAIIESIFVIANKIFFLINEKFETVQNENQCNAIINLKYTELSNYKIIESKYVGPKFAFVKFDDIMTCAKFPNMIERN